MAADPAFDTVAPPINDQAGAGGIDHIVKRLRFEDQHGMINFRGLQFANRKAEMFRRDLALLANMGQQVKALVFAISEQVGGPVILQTPPLCVGDVGGFVMDAFHKPI